MTHWPFGEFYRNRRVLVTGGSGFLGLHLVNALGGLGADVRVLSRTGVAHRITEPTSGVRHFAGDLADRRAVDQAGEGCSVVFNLAAHSGSASSNLEPFVDLETNLKAQLNLLEACRTMAPQPTVVYPSSRLVYRPTPELPVSEKALTQPLSVYGIHKLAAEHYHLLYRHLYGLKAVILRITNPYGRSARPRDNRYSVINWFIQRAVNREVLPIYGDGEQLRDYIHVDDVTAAFLIAAAMPAADGSVLNVGSGTGLSFKAMAAAVVEAAGGGEIQHVPWPSDAASVETGSFIADISRIHEVLGWQPSITFAEGLRDVVRQYRSMERIGGSHP